MTSQIAPLNHATAGRHFDLDWLRVIVVFMLIPFHSARLFDILEDFYVKNDQTSMVLTALVAFMDSWSMPLLFVLAGSATFFALGIRGNGEYLLERVKRLLIPLIFGVLVIVPPQMYFAQRFHSGLQGSFFEYYPRFLDAPDPTGDYAGIGFSYAHLWFIFDLFIISVVVLPLFIYLKSPSGRRMLSAVNGTLRHPWVLFLLLLPLIAITLAPNVMGHPLFVYLLLFVYGFVIISDERLQTAIAQSKRVALVLAIIATLGYFALALGWEAQKAPNTLPWVAFWVCYYGAGWFWILTFYAYARQFLSRGGRVLTYANQAAYPYYIIHQTLIVVLGFYVVQWDIALGVKYIVLVVGAFVVTLGLYEGLVRRIPPIRFLMGVKTRAGWRGAIPDTEDPGSAAVK